ncbi:MAG: response regulator transcription factor [Vallitaleaceae bacterium]|nr:response regulator transcription factor [Vallitaleaceae bacterium]
MKILIVDDDRLVSSSLKTIIESDPDMKVVAIGNNGQEAITLYQQYLPDVLLMDIRMNTLSGIEAGQQLLSQYKEAKILFLTTFSDDEYIISALKMGAKGYLLKQNFDSILPSIKTVFTGQRVFGDEIINKIPSLMNFDARNASSANEEITRLILELSDKEKEIIAYVADGLSNREIADQICLGEGTVRNYVSMILEKLDLRDRTQLAIFYYKNLIN